MAVDIASNDGCLLRSFKNTGSRVLGVEPAVNLAQIANDSGVETIPEFWSVKVAEQIQKKYGTADIITAFNVFSHVHDCTLFLKAIKKLLSPDGYFILESPHVLDLIKNVEFDTVYHEHLSYLSLKSLASLCKKNGFRIAKVKKYSMHGGSIRLFIEHQERADRSDESLMIRLKEEEGEGLHHFERYKQFGTSVQKIREDLIATLQGIHGDGKIVYGFGASAKGNTLLNYCHLDVRSLRGIFDETPEKHDKLTPGMHIPVLNLKKMATEKPDYLLLLAWNFAEEIMNKTKEFHNAGGKYIIPVPKVKVV